MSVIRMGIRRHDARVADSNECALRCDLCGKLAFVKFRPGATETERNTAITAALEDHRQIGCTAAPANVKRVFRLWVPGHAPEMSVDAFRRGGVA